MASTQLDSTAGRAASKKETSQIAPSSPTDVLAHAQGSRDVIQDFCPLSDSLEWELGQEYLRERGNKAFIADATPIPFVVNNDGTLSRHAAEVLFANLQSTSRNRQLENEIVVLELGIGVGLFARYFLDAFRDLCWKHGADYYDRLCYIAADRSAQMLRDVCRHGVLAEHPGRYRLRLVDAMKPETLVQDVMFGIRGEGLGASGKRPDRPFRAVFLNYLLDCLPAAVLQIDGDKPSQLCVRTCVARNVKLEHHSDLSAEALAERAKANDPVARRELLEVYGLFASEYDYCPVDLKTVPYGEFAARFARNVGKRVLHSYGAIQCLEQLLGLVHEQGFILINDYGQTQLTHADEFEHQRFSLATFVGVNFPQLRAYFGKEKTGSDPQNAKGSVPENTRGTDPENTKWSDPVFSGCRWIDPYEETGGIHARLLGHQLGGDTIPRFQECFGKAAHDRLQEPITKARECGRVGRFELAATFYQDAIQKQPANWVLLSEVAMFLTFSLRDPKAGADLAKMALALNPTCSSELWNTLGDALFEWGRVEEAGSAYRRALLINDSDVRARFNLAWVHTRLRDYPAALAMIAEALALDKTGEYRERLLKKQEEALALLAQQHQQAYLRLINLVSKYAPPGDKDKPDARMTHSAD